MKLGNREGLGLINHSTNQLALQRTFCLVIGGSDASRVKWFMFWKVFYNIKQLMKNNN